MNLTPEEKAALERLREDLAIWESFDGEPNGHQDYRTLLAIIDREYPAGDKPVDWPTEPGWWWMETPSGKAHVYYFDGTIIVSGLCFYTRDEAIENKARFLPASVPTFPTRENNS